MRPVRLVPLPPEAIHALAAGELALANVAAPIPLTEYFVGDDQRGIWARRSEQVRAEPASAGWITRVIWAEDISTAVGRAGFHGPPDERGMVEVGYSVDPAFQRRGYARAALEALLERARFEPGVRVVRASISPDNEPSLRLIAGYGFEKTGEQWDDEDGLEIVYELWITREPQARTH